MTLETNHARQLLGPDAPRSEWLAERRKGVTASEIAVVLGISPFDSPFDLHWRKRGLVAEQPDNLAMSLGRFLEAWVAARFAEEHPDFVLDGAGLWQNKKRRWQLATPDRFLYDDPACSEPVALWEGKTAATADGWGGNGTDDIPVYYRAQVLWQLDTMGLYVCYLTCLFLTSREVRHYKIHMDAGEIVVMRDYAQRFLRDLGNEHSPPVDGHKATRAALKTLYPGVEDREVIVPRELAARYHAAKHAAQRAKARVNTAENEIRARLGTAKYAIDYTGRKVATRSVHDRKAYEVKASHIDKLLPASPQGKERQ